MTIPVSHSSSRPPIPTVTLMGLSVHSVTGEQAIAFILDELQAGRGGWVITPNLDHMRRRAHDPQFAGFFAQAQLVLADGMPLVWASRLQGTPLPQRVAGSSLIWTLSAAAAATKSRSIFLLGGDPGTAASAGEILANRYPGLRIAGSACPPVGFERDPVQMQALRDQLIAAAPDIIFVALGSPKQERLIAMLRDCLPRTWWLGVGISFSFVCGQVQRAPVWMQKTGLEWLHRLIQEPRRLFKRYIIHDLPFAAILLAGAILQRFHKTK